MAKKSTPKQKPKKWKPATMTPLQRFYFEKWLNCPKLWGHRSDEHHFYLFIKSAIRGRDSHRDGTWLRYYLEQAGETDEHLVRSLVSKFDTIKDFVNSAPYYSHSRRLEQFEYRENGEL